MKITSNKITYLESQKKLNSLVTKYYKFFLGRIYFTSNDGSQNTFLYQPTLDISKLRKGKCTDYILSWKSKDVYNSRFKPLYALYYIHYIIYIILYIIYYIYIICFLTEHKTF